MTDREAMQKALEALKDVVDAEEARSWGVFGVDKQTPLKRARSAITALRERLAQPEPVIDKSAAIRIATALGWEPRREWVGLEQSEIAEILCDDRWQGRPEYMLLQMQAKLKEKNT